MDSGCFRHRSQSRDPHCLRDGLAVATPCLRVPRPRNRSGAGRRAPCRAGSRRPMGRAVGRSRTREGGLRTAPSFRGRRRGEKRAGVINDGSRETASGDVHLRHYAPRTWSRRPGSNRPRRPYHGRAPPGAPRRRWSLPTRSRTWRRTFGGSEADPPLGRFSAHDTGRTCILLVRSQVLDPSSCVRLATTAGDDPAASGVTGRRSAVELRRLGCAPSGSNRVSSRVRTWCHTGQA